MNQAPVPPRPPGEGSADLGCTLHASCAGVPQVSNRLDRRFPNRLAERIGGEPGIRLARRLGNLRYRRLGSRRYRLGRLAGPDPLSNGSHIKDPCQVQGMTALWDGATCRPVPKR